MNYIWWWSIHPMLPNGFVVALFKWTVDGGVVIIFVDGIVDCSGIPFGVEIPVVVVPWAIHM